MKNKGAKVDVIFFAFPFLMNPTGETDEKL